MHFGPLLRPVDSTGGRLQLGGFGFAAFLILGGEAFYFGCLIMKERKPEVSIFLVIERGVEIRGPEAQHLGPQTKKNSQENTTLR